MTTRSVPELVVFVRSADGAQPPHFAARYLATHRLITGRMDEVERLLQEHVRAGRSVVVDAPGIRSEDRARLVAIARRHHAHAVALWLDAPLQAVLGWHDDCEAGAALARPAVLRERAATGAPIAAEGFEKVVAVFSYGAESVAQVGPT